ncbi:MAG: LarC family nickel insertion protein [Oscillatoriales cyanobacterium]|nr:MAG: LarC family nickel insertion protein [Oscillatoriales cyanobacterium]
MRGELNGVKESIVTKVAYFDCPTGIAGDMCLGALLDLGVPIDYVRQQLDRLGIAGEYRLSSRSMMHNGQRALKAVVELRSGDAGFRVEGPGGHLHEESASDRPTPPKEHHAHHHEHHTHHHEHHTHQAHHHAHQAHHHQEHHTHHHEHHAHQAHHHQEHHEHHEHHQEHHTHTHGRRWPDIEALLLRAELPERVRTWSRSIFRLLAEAEGTVHGIPPEQVQFHEVGAIDAIVDVVGTCLGLDWLGVDRIVFSALPTGGGTVWAAHGRLPVPVPAVLQLLAMGSVPVYANGIDRELVTPTGAAIAVGLADAFGPPPAMTIEQVGLGAGTIALSLPNMVRLWVGKLGTQSARADRTAVVEHDSTDPPAEIDPPPAIDPPPVTDRRSTEHPAVDHPAVDHPPATNRRSTDRPEQPTASLQPESIAPFPIALPNPSAPVSPHPSDMPPLPTVEGHGLETIVVLETQIDDCSPQAVAYAIEQLLRIGALDAFAQPATMKKSRPGIAMTVICTLDHLAVCEEVLFQETTTIGIRRSFQQRRALPRQIETVQTAYGPVRVKVAWRDATRQTIQNIHPEFEDVASLARDRSISWLDVHRAALIAWDQAAKSVSHLQA